MVWLAFVISASNCAYDCYYKAAQIVGDAAERMKPLIWAVVLFERTVCLKPDEMSMGITMRDRSATILRLQRMSERA